MVAPHALHEGSSLRVVEVSKLFTAVDDARRQTQALANVSLSIAPGELVSLIGPSGCGGLIPTGGTCEPGYTCHYTDWEHGCSCACTVEGRLACSKDTVGSFCALPSVFHIT